MYSILRMLYIYCAVDKPELVTEPSSAMQEQGSWARAASQECAILAALLLYVDGPRAAAKRLRGSEMPYTGQ